MFNFKQAMIIEKFKFERSKDDLLAVMNPTISDEELCRRYENYDSVIAAYDQKAQGECASMTKSQKSASKSNKFNLPDLFKGGNDSPEINPLEYV